MKVFLLEPGRQLVEECLLFLCSILKNNPSHPIPHPHCFLPNYSAINQIKQSKKKRKTNELKADKRKENRSSKPSEKNGFIPGGGGILMENLGVVVPLGLSTSTPSKTHKFK